VRSELSEPLSLSFPAFSRLVVFRVATWARAVSTAFLSLASYTAPLNLTVDSSAYACQKPGTQSALPK